MDKWLIPGLGQEIYKISLEQLIVPESKERLRNKTKQKNQTQLGIYAKETQELKLELSEKKIKWYQIVT